MRLLVLGAIALCVLPFALASTSPRVETAPYRATVITTCQDGGPDGFVALVTDTLVGEAVDPGTGLPEDGTCFAVLPGETQATIDPSPSAWDGPVEVWYGFGNSPQYWMSEDSTCTSGPWTVPIPEGATFLSVVVFPAITGCDPATSGTLTVAFS